MSGKTPLGGEWEGQHKLCRLPLAASVNKGGAKHKEGVPGEKGSGSCINSNRAAGEAVCV